MAGKRQGDVYQGQQASPIPVSPNNTIVVATIKSHAANIFGKVGGVNTEIMLDSDSSVSLLLQDTATKMTGARPRPLPRVQLQTASGESIPVIDCVSVDVQLNKMEITIHHGFIVVPNLIASAIIGIDFFQEYNLIWISLTKMFRFTQKQVEVPDEIQTIWNSTMQQKPHM